MTRAIIRWFMLAVVVAGAAALSDVVRRDTVERRMNAILGYDELRGDYILESPVSDLRLIEGSEDGGASVSVSILAEQPAQLWYSLFQTNGQDLGGQLSIQGGQGEDAYRVVWKPSAAGGGYERGEYYFGEWYGQGTAYAYYDFNLDGLFDQRVTYQDATNTGTAILLEDAWTEVASYDDNRFYIGGTGGEVEVYFDAQAGIWTRTPLAE